eukprot:gene17149-biopygen5943
MPAAVSMRGPSVLADFAPRFMRARTHTSAHREEGPPQRARARGRQMRHTHPGQCWRGRQEASRGPPAAVEAPPTLPWPAARRADVLLQKVSEAAPRAGASTFNVEKSLANPWNTLGKPWNRLTLQSSGNHRNL